MTPAQYVRRHHPSAKRELAGSGYQIVAGMIALGRSNLPNHAWEVAARAVARAQGITDPSPWKLDHGL